MEKSIYSIKVSSADNGISSKFNALVDGLKHIESFYGSERYMFFRNEISLDACDILCCGLISVHNLITPVVFEDLNELSKNIGKGFHVYCEDGKLFIEFQFIV